MSIFDLRSEREEPSPMWGAKSVATHGARAWRRLPFAGIVSLAPLPFRRSDGRSILSQSLLDPFFCIDRSANIRFSRRLSFAGTSIHRIDCSTAHTSAFLSDIMEASIPPYLAWPDKKKYRLSPWVNPVDVQSNAMLRIKFWTI